jgi:hypothetical protein
MTSESSRIGDVSFRVVAGHGAAAVGPALDEHERLAVDD